MTIAIANRNGSFGNEHSLHKDASDREANYTRSAFKSACSPLKIMLNSRKIRFTSRISQRIL